MDVVRADSVGGTRSSCIVSYAANMQGITVVRGMRGVGGVCEMFMWLGRMA